MVDQQHIVVADQVFDGVSMHQEMAVVIKDGAV